MAAANNSMPIKPTASDTIFITLLVIQLKSTKLVNSGADYETQTHNLGINDNLRNAAKVIAKGAKIALSELLLGSSQMAAIILENLTKWYDGGDI